MEKSTLFCSFEFKILCKTMVVWGRQNCTRSKACLDFYTVLDFHLRLCTVPDEGKSQH